MKIGMPTLVEYRNLEENIALCTALGLDFIELNMNLPSCTPENLDYMTLLEYKKKYNIDFTIHLPEELDLGSFHHSMRLGHLERCKEAIDWANRAEIVTLNMHLNQGVYFTLPDRRVWIYEHHFETFIENLLESYSVLYSYAHQKGVTLCVENTGNFHIPFVEKAIEELSYYDQFALTWDVGHDAKADFKELVVFEDYNSNIKHMHLHDYNGKSDHQPLYSGIVSIDERLQFAESRGLSVVVEVKTASALKESVEKLRGRFGSWQR